MTIVIDVDMIFIAEGDIDNVAQFFDSAMISGDSFGETAAISQGKYVD